MKRQTVYTYHEKEVQQKEQNFSQPNATDLAGGKTQG